ncbi:MAG: 30S ribosomal protein S16 [Candidatus Berkelbacteria bacterium]|nr:30S ribosomal protein S16 [Candidatus Berkelbacteria bacterium]
MLKIRLSRTGKKNSPSFRIVVTEHYKPVKAGFIEHIGFYNPRSKQFQIDKEKLEVWMKKGATPSTTVNNLLVREKIFAKDKVVKITRVPKKKEEDKKEDKPKATDKKEETKAEIKEESVSAKPSPDKEKAEDKKPKEKEVKEKIEEKKPEVDKK